MVSVFTEDGWKFMQPDGGCEVRIYAQWGSCHDTCMDGPYVGVICDPCASKLLPKMELHVRNPVSAVPKSAINKAGDGT